VTALQVARAIGRSKQAVSKALEGVPPAEVVSIEGKPAAAWRFDQLPRRFQRALAIAQSRGGFRTLSDLIANPPRRWAPPAPLASVGEALRSKAELLREALRPALERKDSTLLGSSELKRSGVESYQRVFGHPITERQWWSLFTRTLVRDGGFEEWDRLEIYLDERRPGQAPSPAERPVAEPLLADVGQILSLIRDPKCPSVEEKDAVWLAAVELVQAQGTPAGLRKTKRKLVDFLAEHAPWIGETRNAIRANLDRKVARAAGCANAAVLIRDGRSLRPVASGVEALWPKEDVDQIVWAATANHGGRISEAVRELSTSGKLTDGTLARLSGASDDKSYIPASLRDLVTPQVEALMPHHQGPRASRLLVPHLDRDYSGLVVMDQVQADDFTMPVYFYVPDGEGWFRLTRGQCLIAIDVRSQRVLSWVLIPAEQYNALSIRTLFARTFEEHGIPKCLYLERGIWQRSRIVAGAKVSGGDTVSPLKTEMGLKTLGIAFSHALRPQAKTIEHVGALLQNRMHSVPGYCGRNERVDCPEVTHRNRLEVEAHRSHPKEHFLSFEEWNEQLAKIMRSYNSEKHGSGSRIIPGMSPDEAFEKFWPAEPGREPCKFGPEARHLLAHIQKPVVCGAGGISFEIGAERFRYFDSQTGERQGQKLIAWFNPDAPENCTFTNERGRDAFTVERHTPVPAFGAGEDLEAEMRKAKSHAGSLKSRYNVLKATFSQKFARPIVDLATADLGQTLENQGSRVKERRAKEAKSDARIARLSAKVGIPTTHRTGLVESGLQMFEEARARAEAEELIEGES
jgi:hypothetical protein